MIGKDPRNHDEEMCFQASLLILPSEIRRTLPIFSFVSETNARLQVQSGCFVLNPLNRPI